MAASCISIYQHSRFDLTLLHKQAAQMLNAGLPEGMTSFTLNEQKDILGRTFPIFKIVEGQIVSGFDLIDFKNGLFVYGYESCGWHPI
ncbi:MAG: hypothetical protein F6K19_05485 [Cyanothece sp. SIO1E1]|nr:hypothetical protein [Cyanothece sp. SIO1E1]